MIRPPALLHRLLGAVPRAWAGDRPFRVAVIGAGVALAMLLGRLAAGDTAGPARTPAARSPALPPPGARYDPGAPATPSTPQPTAGPIAPGRTLESVRIETDPSTPADRFGTPGALQSSR